MQQFSYRKSLIALCMLTGLSACSSTQLDSNAFRNERTHLATSLEDKGHYAEALVQWRVLRTYYPNDESITNEARRLETLIAKKVELLKRKTSASRDGKSQKIYIDILALDPNNVWAKKQLEEVEWEISLASASEKTENIKKYFVESQVKAKKSIEKNDFLSDAERLEKQKSYPSLMALSTDYLSRNPSNVAAKDYRYKALVGLGNTELRKNDEEKALVHFELALSESGNKSKSLRSKVDGIKSDLSKRYYKEGVKVFKSDIDKAVELFQTSVYYDNDNLKAHQYLARSLRMQENLKRIRNN